MTGEQVRTAARKWLDSSKAVTGYLVKDNAPEPGVTKREEKRS